MNYMYERKWAPISVELRNKLDEILGDDFGIPDNEDKIYTNKPIPYEIYDKYNLELKECSNKVKLNDTTIEDTINDDEMEDKDNAELKKSIDRTLIINEKDNQYTAEVVLDFMGE